MRQRARAHSHAGRGWELTMRRCVLSSMALLGLALLLGFASSARAEQRRPSDTAIGQRLLSEALAPVLEAAEASTYSGIAIRVDGSASQGAILADVVADFLLDRGYDVWVLDRSDESPAESVLLELSPEDVSLEYPEQRRTFFGLGSRKSRRSASVVLDATLSHELSGQRFFSGLAQARYSDWVSEDDIEETKPESIFAGGSSASDRAKATTSAPVGWLEKGIVAGMLGGVVIIYFSGAS